MRLVFRHGAQHLPSGDGTALWRSAFFREVLIRHSLENLKSLSMHAFDEGNHIREPIRKIASAAFVAARAPAGALCEDVALGRGDVAGQVAESELAFATSSLELVRRNASDEAHGSFVYLLEIVEEFLAVHACFLLRRICCGLNWAQDE
jgi:hypothetical protein